MVILCTFMCNKLTVRMKLTQFKLLNNSILLKTEKGFALININKVKLIQPSVHFPYLQKRLLAKSFLSLGVFSTSINIFKLIIISSYSETNAWTAYIIAFLVIQFCSITFFVVGVRWIRQCRKYKRAFPYHSLEIKLVFEDASVKTFTVGDAVNIPHMVSELSKEKEVC